MCECIFYVMGKCVYTIHKTPYTLVKGGGKIFSDQEYFSPTAKIGDIIDLCRNPVENAKLSEMAGRIRVSDPDMNLVAVYAIEAGAYGFCKVGLTSEPLKRLKTLQVAHWADLRIASLVWTTYRQAVEIEKLVLKAGKEMGIGANGEWLATDSAEVAELCIKAARYSNSLIADSGAAIRNLNARVGNIYKDRREKREKVFSYIET